ncbi:phosphoribosylformylglycinamidine cyclo-ligase [Candidatus Peregrinibacteria bacterium]|nr:phosphoribosylformylglycinamidine cyclo-ligase [Candidatus Peregrinibacteria bacterium]
MPTKRTNSLSYAASGVNISAADRAKRGMAKDLKTTDRRVLNALGAFASLFDARFPGYRHPVLVLKTEEPGSKQKLALEHGHARSLCFDMINHLVNDIAVMGATPLAVQDAIICGKLESATVREIVRGIADACRAQGCVLTGGETSEQPCVLPTGTYIVTSSIVGVVEKARVIDGSRIREGDCVIGVASNGLHTNGYSLVRALLTKHPRLAKQKIGSRTFLETILLPHTCYYRAIRDLFQDRSLHGMAHITGSGIGGNLKRILPRNLDARINLSAINILPVFRVIRALSSASDREMLRTFNLGIGLAIVAKRSEVKRIITHLRRHGHRSSVIGEIVRGRKTVKFGGGLQWDA